MTKNEYEIKSLVLITAILFVLHLVCGAIGFLSRDYLPVQILFYQMGAATAISGSVIAGRYIGWRGEHMAASGFVLLGIAHGINMGSVAAGPDNFERGITMVMPMMAALVFIFWCSIFPLWLRLASFIPVGFFLMMYISHKNELGLSFSSLVLGFATLQIIEILWAYFIWKDWKATRQ